MPAENTRCLARIGSPGNGVSIAAVFGVEWISNLIHSACNAAVEAWRTCFRLWSAKRERCTIYDDELWQDDFLSCSNGTYTYRERCTICDDELWRGDFVSCSNDENRHWYCPKCFESTITAMITGDVAFSYDPRTTFPLCCYCLPSSSSILDTKSLSPQMRRSWDKAIIARQLQALGLPLITCAHCSYVVVGERKDSVNRSVPETTPDTSLRRRLVQTISSYVGSSPVNKPERFHCPECDFLTCLPPQGCGAHFQPGFADDHKCRTDDLRLEIERAVDKSLIYSCPSCSAALVKDGGCNHCTCVCRAEYCHICHASLGRGESSVWRPHFCDHFIESGQGRCTQRGCRRCPLYSDRDDEGIRKRVEGEVTKRWRRQQARNGIKRLVGWG
ncbi:hypothetical protein B0H16DRAFT_345689 [Mycena metata]|uniref:RING-type domain-containing protein n=1 Tax=Mycena metata TaxID=1033252 RepID=A0AAD7HKR7_9AGAR|nr:hypothetical protein B0H16DRAFT_345689 [Mycena metata]